MPSTYTHIHISNDLIFIVFLEKETELKMIKYLIYNVEIEISQITL